MGIMVATFYSGCEDRRYPGNFQNKSVSVHKYTFFLAKLKEGEDIPFLERAGGGGGYSMRFPPKAMRCGESFFFGECRGDAA